MSKVNQHFLVLSHVNGYTRHSNVEFTYMSEQSMILTILCGEKPGYTPVNKDSLDAVGGPCGAVEEFSICKIDKRIAYQTKEENVKSRYRVNIEIIKKCEVDWSMYIQKYFAERRVTTSEWIRPPQNVRTQISHKVL